MRPELEPMEARRLLATVTWISDTDGFWDDPNNWQDSSGVKRVPINGDDVVINRPSADVTVTFRGGSTAGTVMLRNLQSTELLAMTGGVLGVNGTGQIRSLQMVNGSLTGSGQVQISESLTWLAGSMNGAGTTTLAQTAVTTISSANIQRTIRNSGLVTWDGAGSIALNGVWQNLAGSIFTIDGSNLIFGTGTFRNQGALIHTPGTITSFSVPLDHSGAMTIANGTLALSRGGALRGSGVLAGAGALLLGAVLPDSASYSLENGSSFTGPGKLQVQTSVNVNGISQVANLEMSGSGALRFDIGGRLPGLSYDQLVITEQAALGGRVDVGLAQNFQPSAGDIFRLIQGRTSGTFAVANLPALPPSVEWLVDQGSYTLVASATGSTQPADLQPTIFASPNPGVKDADLTYHVSVSNAGPGPATGVTLTFTLPANVTFVSATGGVTPVGDVLTFNLPALGSGQFTLAEVTVRPNATGTITAMAEAHATQNDPVMSNNLTSLAISVTDAPTATSDLRVTVVDSPDPVVVGQPLTYQVRVRNLGPDPAQGVQLIDQLPSTVTSVTTSAGQVSVSDLGLAVLANLGTLGVNEEVVVSIQATPRLLGTIVNRVSAYAASTDPNAANNEDITTSTLVAAPPVSDVRITQTVTPQTGWVGRALTYRLTVTNRGPDTATNTIVRDTLPANVTFISASSGGTFSSGVVTFNLGSLPSGATRTLTIVIRPRAAGFVTNTAQVLANEDDPNPVDNKSTLTTQVNPPPRVTSLARYGITPAQPTYLVATFSQAMNPTTVTRLRNYYVKGPGPDGQLGTADDRTIRIVEARYTASKRTVRLRTEVPLQPFLLYIFVMTSGVTNRAGVPLDGNGSGTPGTPYVRAFGHELIKGPSNIVAPPRRRPAQQR